MPNKTNSIKYPKIFSIENILTINIINEIQIGISHNFCSNFVKKSEQNIIFIIYKTIKDPINVITELGNNIHSPKNKPHIPTNLSSLDEWNVPNLDL
ncbi:MAG: hypothetical protein VB038_08710 [Methanobrevibacter sp.]|uniref:hypothetical protein n=1 Tax=Methanobrevibacter sp. TaxID=66852 RepID=UPI002B1F6B8C|nr:hypothetical protein [Methanobrevibacter sp.]MEA4957796.1 hypothetical protein [Methanobrevibacter sp.]